MTDWRVRIASRKHTPNGSSSSNSAVPFNVWQIERRRRGRARMIARATDRHHHRVCLCSASVSCFGSVTLKVSAFVSSAHKFGSQPTRPTVRRGAHQTNTRDVLLLLIQLRFNLRSDNIFRIECVLRNREYLKRTEKDFYDFIGLIVIDPNEIAGVWFFAEKFLVFFFDQLISLIFTIRT